MIKYTYVTCLNAGMRFVFAVMFCFVYFYGLLNEMYLESCQTEMELFAKIVNE